MRKIYLHFLAVLLLLSCTKTSVEKDFTTLFEISKGNETPTYKEVISFYKNLAKSYPEISMFSVGETDSGYPLHLVVFTTDKKINLEEIKNSSKNRVLINNGIHPGEPDGIDASMLLLRDIVQNDSLKKAYQNTIISVIPVYNIGGALHRNSHSRANQNGPKEYGFRGNTQNYDLNRDFIKQDTKNAVTFAKIFYDVNPDVFIDNHVSNGADYQYTLTHLFTQHNKLGGKLGEFLEEVGRSYLENNLAKKEIPITPYVNVWGSTPDKGWTQFLDSPRYSTGYSTLFNSLGMMVETHMLKPYKQRVEQTYQLMQVMLEFTEQYSKEIKEKRANAVSQLLEKRTYPIQFTMDKDKPSKLLFKGYEASMIDSKVTNGKRLFYDKEKPYTKEVSYYNQYKAVKEIVIPKAYVLKKGWNKVMERLDHNFVQYSRFQKDTILNVVSYRIKDFATRNAYEGHYVHYNTSVILDTVSVAFKKGDVFIPTQQERVRYILETLEPEAVDSFFNWNFFDAVLQQKEGYSAYVFEDIAEQFLVSNPVIAKEFAQKRNLDTTFAKNPRIQLDWVYKKSPYYEKTHKLLPVYKVY